MRSSRVRLSVSHGALHIRTTRGLVKATVSGPPLKVSDAIRSGEVPMNLQFL